MKNNEHLALFVLGAGTLGITFILLFALSDRNTGSIPAFDSQVQVSSAQASIEPQGRAPEAPSVEVLDRQVAETFAKAAEYLGGGTFQEKEHIALLERLEFYGGMSSIKPQRKKAAQDLIKDMGRLLTLKESVASQVRLSARISAVASDVQIHIARGERDESEARKLTDRIETLYTIRGLSEEQNAQLRSALAALKRAYRTSEASTASAPAQSREADAPKAVKPSAPAADAARPEVQPKAEPMPAQKAPVAAAAPKETASPAPREAAAPEPKQAAKLDPLTVKYNKVMTYVATYFTARVYDREKHAKLTSDLLALTKDASSLSEKDQENLRQTIAKMKRIDQKMKSN